MAFEPRQFDEHGLPVPQRFVDNRPPDDFVAQRPKISQSRKRFVVVVLLLLVVLPIIFGPRILSAARETLARWLSNRAQTKLELRDLRGALDDVNQAIGWNPNAWKAYQLRGMVREEMQELEPSLADFTKAIDLLEARDVAGRNRWRGIDRFENVAMLHMQRSWVNVRLKHTREAIDDATEAVNRLPCPATYNARAYARAVLQTELKEALDDIDKSLKNVAGGDDADYRDTRGYILHLLGRNDEAITELDQAILQTEQRRDNLFDPRQFRRRDDVTDHALAVMYQHRSLAHEKLGHKEQADADLQVAKRRGYDPEKGVL